MGKRVPRAVTIVALALSCAALAPASHADTGTGAEPWLTEPAFSIPAGELQRQLAALPPTEDAASEILLYSATVELDSAKRSSITTHLIYRIVTQAGVDGASTVQEVWAPWREKRPEIRVRVVTSGGMEHELDPDTLTDAPLGGDAEDVFSDLRVVEGPLPAVAPGSIVELEIRAVEESPLFEAGAVTTIAIPDLIPVRHARVRIDAPRDLTLRSAARPAGAFREIRESTDGRVRRTFEMDSFIPSENPEAYLPPDLDPAPIVAFATGESWGAIATAYSKVVDERIAGADLAKTVAKATASATTRSEKILALVHFLHETVRYTGVEFGWAGIVPAQPKTTLTRKYGDCKDKSTLLVAMLRQAGIPADLALLETGLGADVEHDLPGFGAFDHAIVKVPGDPALWIDATSEYAEPGTLTAGVEGRWALVIRDDTTALERIPEARSADNTTHELREWFLAENGPARIVETTTASGVPASGYRENHGTNEAADVEKGLASYVEGTYGAAKLDSFTESSPRDVSHPFELRLEASQSTIGRSDGRAIQVPIPLDELASPLAAVVPPRAPEGRLDDDGDETPRDPPRRDDFRVVYPHVATWTYTIHVPPGFSVLPLPAPIEREIGPATLAATFRRDDGTVTVEARLDTGPRQWTAAEFEGARRAMYELSRDSPWTVSLENDGMASLDAGRFAEAMSEFRRLAALHPAEALHHDQMADVLLATGFGEAARREAELGVGLEPDNAEAHEKLGLVRLNDPLGREFHDGADLQGAEAALLRAKELGPRRVPARALLALVYEHEPDGTRYSSTAALDKAIAEYRALRADIGETTVDTNLLFCLGYAGRMQELHEEAAKLPPSDQRNRLLVASTAAVSGFDAARSEASRLTSSPQQRVQLLGSAGWALIAFRRYAEAAPLLEEGFREKAGPETRALLAAVNEAKRHEDASFETGTPDGFIGAFMRSVWASDSIEAGLRPFLSRRVHFDESELERQLGAISFLMKNAIGTILPIESLLDLALATTHTTATPIGSTGFRVRLNSTLNQQSFELSVVKEDGTLKLIAAPPDFSAVGVLVPQLIDQGKLDDARRWLDHARGEFRGAPIDDPVRGHPFTALWSAGDPPDPESMRLAAAALRLGHGEIGDVLPVLEHGQESVSDEDGWKLDFALALASGETEDFDAAANHARKVLERFPRSPSARELMSRTWLAGDRLDEAETLAGTWLDDDPSNRAGLTVSLHIAQQRNDVSQAVAWFERLEQAGEVEPSDLNNQAWFLLVHGQAESALSLAERAIQGSKIGATLHTLAAVYAELGRLKEAHDTLFEKIEWFGGGETEPVDGMVFGRIAEQLDEPDLALGEYHRALDGLGGDLESTRTMLDSRIEALQGAADDSAGKRTTESNDG